MYNVLAVILIHALLSSVGDTPFVLNNSVTGPTAPADSIRLEARQATLSAGVTLRETPGATGKGYAGDFVPQGSKITWTIPNAHAGIYSVRIRYQALGGQKGYDLVVNGHKSSNMFPATQNYFSEVSGGKVELMDGANTISIERGWGYFQINVVELSTSPPQSPLRPIPAQLSDKNATPATHALFAMLRRDYGTKTLSGQAEFGDTRFLEDTLGSTPAIQAGDFIEYSPTRRQRGSDPHDEVENVIAAAKRGQIASMLWHWNAPSGILDAPYTDKAGKKVDAHWYFGFYTHSTTFDLAKAMSEPKSPEYAQLVSDIDVIATQMKKFSDAGVPILFRPLHEAEGGWFWWGAKGPEPCKKLWRLLHERLTKTHGLHNLIWVYSSGTDPKWYPGDDVVDIVAVDQYPTDVSDPLVSVWETLLAQYDGRKMLALTEFGGVPDIARMRRFGVRWSYFASWQGNDLGPRRHALPELKRLYTASGIVTLKDLPASQTGHVHSRPW